MNKVKRFLIGATAGAVMFGSIVVPSFAAQPAVQACLGNDISGYAKTGETDPGSFFAFGPGAGWGGFISGVARIPGFDGNLGVGGEINAHQAGDVPDWIISNSCN